MKKAILIIPCLAIITSITSCDNRQKFSASIYLYDADNPETLIATLSGTAGTLIKDNKELSDILSNAQIKQDTTFKGWYTSPSLEGQAININYIPYHDVSYYGFFAEHVSLTFEIPSNQGISYPENTFENGKYVLTGVEGDEIPVDLPEVSRNQFTFSGWVDESNNLFNSRYFPGSDLVLHPSFTSWPTLSFVTNVDNYTIDPIVLEPGQEVPNNIIDLSKMDKGENYKLEGWYTTPDFQEGTLFTFDKMPDTDTVIYARFLEKRTIHFDTTGFSFSVNDITCFPNENIEAPTPESFIYENHYFVGWSETVVPPDAEEYELFEFSNMPDRNVTLYPVFLSNPTIEVIFPDGNSQALLSYSPGSTIDLEDLFRDDIAYDDYGSYNGFYTLNSENEKVYIEDSNNYVVPSKDLAIYLEYLEEYDVTFSFLDILKQPIPGIEPYVIHTNSTLSDPKDEIISYVKSVLPTSNYSIDSYLQNHEADQYQNFYFPYNIASDLSLFVVLAEPVSFSFDFVNTDLVEIRESINIDTYQNKYLGEPVYINEETSTYYLYGNDTGLSISQYEFKGAYLTKNGVDDLDTRYNLPIYAPNTSYNSEENHINLVFKSI